MNTSFFNHFISVVGDPHFMGQYYKWKQQDRQNQVQWESK